MTIVSRSIGALTLFLLVGSVNARQPDDGDVEARATVVVAKRQIPLGTFIKEPDQFVETKEVDESDVPTGALTKIEELRDVRIVRAVAEDGILKQEDVLRGAAKPAARIPQGFRAMAIRINPEGVGSGFDVADSRVDVIWCWRRENEPIAQTILEDVLILAVELDAKTGFALTLAVTPEDAQRLVLAAANGDLHVSVRPPRDSVKMRLPATRLSDLGQPAKDTEAEEEELPSVPPVPKMPPTPAKEEAKAPEPPALRAFAVRLAPETMGAGFIVPGSRVDVLVTVTDGAEARTQKVLENIQVLAVDGPAVRQVKGTREMLGQTATLAVTPDEAERLQKAVSSGEIRLSLRPPEETKPSQR